MTKQRNIILKPIGVIHNDVEDSRDASFDWSPVISNIELDERYTLYTHGIDQHSHLLILFWMDRPEKKQLQPLVYPRGDKSLGKAGLFATRSPHRPNPVGLKLAELIEVHGNVLIVKGLDALNNTPVIDIKPYLPGYDSPI